MRVEEAKIGRLRAKGLVDDKAPILVQRTKPSLGRFPDVESAVAALRPAMPLFCIAPRQIDRNVATFLKHFPGDTYYAVKVNTDPYVLSRIAAAGVRHYDVASLNEVRLIRQMFPDASLAFMHTVKSREAIRASYHDYGVRVFAVDCVEELEKIREETGGAKDLTLMVRLTMPKGSAMHPLSDKFGAPLALAVELLRQVEEMGCQQGITFHVGSQTASPDSYKKAIRLAGDAIKSANAKLAVLDIGGGFPIRGLGMDVPSLETFFDVIQAEVKKLRLPENCALWAEPGRAITGDTTEVVVRVELRKGNALYLNDGGYGTLFDLCWLKNQNAMRVIRPEGQVATKTANFLLYGPTCDSVDVIPGPFAFPEDIKEGDWIAISGLGAYGFAMQTGFNGFYADAKVEIIPPEDAKIVRLPRKGTRRG